MIEAEPFWDKQAGRYVVRPIKDVPSYEVTLEKTRAHLTPQMTVLELGCGSGNTAIALAPDVARIVATDLSSQMIEMAPERAAKAGVSNVEFIHDDVDGALSEGAIYDAILAFNLLHLIRDIPAVLAKAHSSLKPGGVMISKSGCLGSKAVLFAPVIGIMRLIGKAPYVKIMSPKTLERMFTSAGFEIVTSEAIPAGSENQYIVARKR